MKSPAEPKHMLLLKHFKIQTQTDNKVYLLHYTGSNKGKLVRNAHWTKQKKKPTKKSKKIYKSVSREPYKQNAGTKLYLKTWKGKNTI